jgi:hypothetical protein
VGLTPIAAAPGICLSASNYAVGKDFAYVGEGNTFRQGSGRWVAGQNIEFIAGFAQKIAGWVEATSSKVVGISRAVCPWRDNAGSVRTAIGTDSHLYYLLGGTLTDITPLRTLVTGTLSSPFTTIINSYTIVVADTNQELNNGDWVYLSASAAVGGLTINGWYSVSNQTSSGYSIVSLIAATSSATGGGTTNFSYPRVNLTNPFTTTALSPLVNVKQTNHSAAVGNYVDFSGASPVGGLTINGEYQITAVVDANNYTITAASNASSSTTGGGTVSVTCDIYVPQPSGTGSIGWGQGAWNAGVWGGGLNYTASLANGWTLSAYGNQMLANAVGGTIYVYDPVQGGRAYPLLNAPTTVNAMFVTPERFVVALGINSNLMELAWCDQQDYTVWTTTATNTANSGRTLIGGSYLSGGIAIRDGTSLIFSDRCVFNMTYTGTSEIYTTQQVGDNCGLISPTAVCAEGGTAYWMSDKDWWTWNGSTSVLPSDDVRSSVFQGGINTSYLNKCTAMLNRAKRQVRFFYPGAGETENSAGMIFQYDQNCWGPLGFARSAGFDAELLSTPISTDIDGYIYFEETGTDANGAALPCNIELGLTDLGNGDRNSDIMGIIPDFQTLVGTIDISIETVYFSPYTSETDGPYPVVGSSTQGQRIDLRSNGKAFSISMEMNDIGETFRLGLPRLDVSAAGARS